MLKGIDAGAIRPHYISFQYLKSIGFNVPQLVELGFNDPEYIRTFMGIFPENQILRAGFSAKDLKERGNYSPVKLLRNGFTFSQLKQAGFQLKYILDAMKYIRLHPIGKKTK